MPSARASPVFKGLPTPAGVRLARCCLLKTAGKVVARAVKGAASDCQQKRPLGAQGRGCAGPRNALLPGRAASAAGTHGLLRCLPRVFLSVDAAIGVAADCSEGVLIAIPRWNTAMAVTMNTALLMHAASASFNVGTAATLVPAKSTVRRLQARIVTRIWVVQSNPPAGDGRCSGLVHCIHGAFPLASALIGAHTANCYEHRASFVRATNAVLDDFHLPKLLLVREEHRGTGGTSSGIAAASRGVFRTAFRAEATRCGLLPLCIGSPDRRAAGITGASHVPAVCRHPEVLLLQPRVGLEDRVELGRRRWPLCGT
mmetsp:Transcript_75735/g.245135  ORF Transcript_75735/g.245135 Transcript_75735/m.245135 type:complete len:314 (+) Transcript_75735:380-1321(+)